MNGKYKKKTEAKRSENARKNENKTETDVRNRKNFSGRRGHGQVVFLWFTISVSHGGEDALT